MNSDILLDNLAAIAGGPSGVDRLRGLILELAVRGKLGTQNPKDEPASVLLQTARNEKARLRNEGKVKGGRTVDTESNSNPSSLLPAGWVLATLHELGMFTGGVTPTTSNLNYWNGEIPWVSPKDVKSKYIKDSELKVSQAALDNFRLSRIPKDSIIIVARSGILKRTLPVAITKIDCTVNQDIKVIIPYLPAIAEYLRILLKGHERFILTKLVKGGMTVQSLKYDEFEHHPFPLPPLAEQHRIVEKVDRLMALCDDLDARQRTEREERRRLRTASLTALEDAATAEEAERAWAHVAGEFGRLVDTIEDVKEFRALLLQLTVKGTLSFSLPDNVQSIISDSATGFSSQWELSTFESIFQFIDYRGKTPKKEPSGIRLITAKNVRSGYINNHPEEFISPLTYQSWMTRGFPQTGDLLITTEAPMGNVAVLTVDEPIALAQRVIDLHPKQEINSNFYQYLIMSRLVQNSIAANSSGMTATGIKAARLKKIILPFPSLAEQNHIVEKVDRLMALCDTIEAGIRARDAALEAFAGAACRAVLGGSAPAVAPAAVAVKAAGQQRLSV